MGFRNDAWATVWEVVPMEGKGFTKVRVSTSRKKKDGTFEQDFSGYCMFVGAAEKPALELKEKDRIQLIRTEVTTKFNKDTQQEYVNYRVSNFEKPDVSFSDVGSAKPKSKLPPLDEGVEGEADDDENTPF